MKLIISTLLIFFFTTAISQNKKEQIAKLTFSRDSLIDVLTNDRTNFNQTINQLNETIDLQSEEKTQIKKQLVLKQTLLDVKTAEFKALAKEIERLENILDQKTKEIEKLKEGSYEKFLITNNSVGHFKFNEPWQDIAINKYAYKYIQGYGSCRDGCCDGGFELGKNIVNGQYGSAIEYPEITIGTILFNASESETKYKSNSNVFFISTDNCAGWYWKDKIRYFVVYSKEFKTKEDVGVGTTLEKLQQLYGKVKIQVGWLEEDPNALIIYLNDYPNLQFIIEVEDAIGGYDKFSSLGLETASISHFKKNTEIKRIVVSPAAE